MRGQKRRFVTVEEYECKPYRVMVVKRGKVFGHIASWAESCSGCYEGYESSGHYPYDDKAHCVLGAGCDECGYHGKVRVRCWFPLPKDVQRMLNQEMQLGGRARSERR